MEKALSFKGVEPDASFYFQNANHLIGKDDIDLEQDPPPDVVVEVDVTNSSLGKFAIYAALGIPEVLRYTRKACQFYTLSGGKYDEIPESRFLSKLTGKMIFDALEIAKAKGQDEARRVFRQRVKALRRQK